MNATLESNGSVHAPENPSRVPTSAILRAILTDNPRAKRFSVKRILASIGSDRFEASLMAFAIPGIVPVPVSNQSGIVALPTGAIAYQLASGQKHIALPRFIMKQSVPRRSLAVAIHAILPVLEAAESVMRPRWSWVSCALSRRAIGFFVFLLAVAIAYPLSGYGALHAMSIFTLSLGLAEGDGIAVLLGFVAGLLSLAVLAATGVSPRALRSKAFQWLRKLAQKLGLNALSGLLDKHGYKQLARVLRFEWSSLLLMWDPERVPSEREQATAERRARRHAEALLRRPRQRSATLRKRARRLSAAEASLRSPQALRA